MEGKRLFGWYSGKRFVIDLSSGEEVGCVEARCVLDVYKLGGSMYPDGVEGVD